MSRLIGLYPAAWRARYGDELLAKTVGEIRSETGADREDAPATAGDVVRATAWGVLGLIVGTVLLLTLLPLVPIGLLAGNLAKLSSRDGAAGTG